MQKFHAECSETKILDIIPNKQFCEIRSAVYTQEFVRITATKVRSAGFRSIAEDWITQFGHAANLDRLLRTAINAVDQHLFFVKR